MKVLVTGGTGFLGEHLLAALQQGGGDEVLALCRKDSARMRELGARVVIGDVSDAQTLAAAMVGVEGVYHLAGMVSRRAEDGQRMMRLHVDGTRAVMEAARAANVKRVVVASSSGTVAVSEEAEPIADESFPYATKLVGNWPYYLSKIYQEKLAFELGAKLGIEVVVVNPSLLLGPGDARQSSTGDVARFLRREIPAVPTGGVNFVDVRDAAAATVAAMQKGRAGERYLLGGPNWTCAEFFGRLERSSKVRAPMLKLPKRVSLAGASLLERLYEKAGRRESPVDRISVEMGFAYWYCDSSKAQRELGFTSRDPAETLDDTIRYLRRAG